MVRCANMNKTVEDVIHVLLRYCFINIVRFMEENYHSGNVIFFVI